MKISPHKIKLNPDNPRFIRDESFNKLVQSIKDFPEMLELRPIVVNEEMVVLGGNMRLRACKEAGIKEVPYIVAHLTEQEEKEFIIKDNLSMGEWDWEALANTWDAEDLVEWGLEMPFIEDEESKQNQNNILKLKYPAEEYEKVMDALSRHNGSPEEVIYTLLGLNN